MPPGTRPPAQDEKQEKPALLYSPQYMKRSSEIMIYILAPLPATVTELQILATNNKPFHPQKYLQAHRSMQGKIMLLTSPHFPATDALNL